MAVFKLEDLKGSVEVLLFPDAFEKEKDRLLDGAEVIVEGRLDTTEDNPKIIASSLKPITEVIGNLSANSELPKSQKSRQTLHIRIDESQATEDVLESLRNILRFSKGECKVYFHIRQDSQETVLLAGNYIKVNPEQILLDRIEEVLGKGTTSVITNGQ